MGKPSTKFPFVSLYESKGRWRVTTCRIGGRRITRRLGTSPAHARRYAASVSDWIQQWKSRLISEARLLQLLGESLPVDALVDRYREHLLTDKGRGRGYVATLIPRLRLLLKRGEVTQVKHLTVTAVNAALEDLRENGGDDRKRFSDQTLRHYQTGVRQFAKWLKRQSVVEADPLANIEGLSVATKVHGRRAPTLLETQLLIAHTWDKPRGAFTTRGRDRAMLYLMAMSTGLRVNELRQVRREWIDLETGVLSVPGDVTKNGKEALQPLPSWLLAAVAEWHPGPGLLWEKIHSAIAKTLRSDQRDARDAWIAAAPNDEERARRETSNVLVYRTSAGVFDFHALRHFYVTAIGRSGATVKETQTLARHSTPMLTLGTYSHTEAEKLRAVVDGAFTDPTPRHHQSQGGGEEAQAHRAAQ